MYSLSQSACAPSVDDGDGRDVGQVGVIQELVQVGHGDIHGLSDQGYAGDGIGRLVHAYAAEARLLAALAVFAILARAAPPIVCIHIFGVAHMVCLGLDLLGQGSVELLLLLIGGRQKIGVGDPGL